MRASATLAFFSTLFFSCVSINVAFGDDPAGQVMLSSGKLEASLPNQPMRALRRGSDFFKSDTLKTDDQSEAQLRFTDGTLVSLRPDSVLKIDNYQFDKTSASNPKKAVYAVDLIEGGFRSISGKIAKTNPDEYKIKTNVATIGVRGTEFSLMLDTIGGLGAATYKGLIYLKNAAGAIEIGDSAEYGYAYVASSTSKPRGEPIRPAFMLNDPRIIGLSSSFNKTSLTSQKPRSSVCLQ